MEDKTVSYYEVQEGSVIHLQVEVEQEESVYNLKMKIYWIISIDPEQQRLIYQGQEVEEGTISQFNIQEGSVIHLSIWSTGSGASREI